MARALLIAFLSAVAAALCAPLSAMARTPCPGEQLTATVANGAQVSDAIVCLSNQIRVHHGLPEFVRDGRLDAAAADHSLDMATRNFFDHTNPDGLSPGQRATAQGYTTSVGENIASGYSNARAVVLGWLRSAGHCRNMLSAAVHLGVGTAVGARPYYTQAFGDYFSRQVDDAASDGCPYTLDLDTLASTGAPLVAQPATTAPGTPAVATATYAASLALRSQALSPRRFRAGRRRGTTITYRLSAPAMVTFRIQRAADAGRYRTVSGRLRHTATAGANRLRFTGGIAGKPLRPGRYRLSAVATNAAGVSARAVRATFVVIRR